MLLVLRLAVRWTRGLRPVAGLPRAGGPCLRRRPPPSCYGGGSRVVIVEATVVDSQAAVAFCCAPAWCCGVRVAPRSGSLLALPRPWRPLDLRAPVSVACRCPLPMQHRPRRSGSCVPSGSFGSSTSRRLWPRQLGSALFPVLACRRRLSPSLPLCRFSMPHRTTDAVPPRLAWCQILCRVYGGARCHLPAANPLQIWRLRPTTASPSQFPDPAAMELLRIRPGRNLCSACRCW